MEESEIVGKLVAYASSMTFSSCLNNEILNNALVIIAMGRSISLISGKSWATGRRSSSLIGI